MSSREGEPFFALTQRLVLSSRFSAHAVAAECVEHFVVNVWSADRWRLHKSLMVSRECAFTRLWRRDRSLGFLGVLAGRAECRSRPGWFALGRLFEVLPLAFDQAKSDSCFCSVLSNSGFFLMTQFKAIELGGKTFLNLPRQLLECCCPWQQGW